LTLAEQSQEQKVKYKGSIYLVGILIIPFVCIFYISILGLDAKLAVIAGLAATTRLLIIENGDIESSGNLLTSQVAIFAGVVYLSTARVLLAIFSFPPHIILSTLIIEPFVVFIWILKSDVRIAKSTIFFNIKKVKIHLLIPFLENIHDLQRRSLVYLISSSGVRQEDGKVLLFSLMIFEAFFFLIESRYRVDVQHFLNDNVNWCSRKRCNRYFYDWTFILVPTVTVLAGAVALNILNWKVAFSILCISLYGYARGFYYANFIGLVKAEKSLIKRALLCVTVLLLVFHYAIGTCDMPISMEMLVVLWLGVSALALVATAKIGVKS